MLPTLLPKLTVLNKRNSTHLGCLIAIDELPQELRQMRQGGLYCLGIEREADALSMLREMLVYAEPKSRAVVVSSSDSAAVLAELDPGQSPKDVRAYRLMGEPLRALRAFPKALNARLSPHRRTIMLLIPDEFIDSVSSHIESIFQDWSKWLASRGCVLLIVLHGSRAPELTAQLSTFNNALYGAAQLTVSGSDRLYRVLHWRNALAVTGRAEVNLIHKSGAFKVNGTDSTLPGLGEDHDQVFLERNVLEGAALELSENWQVLDSAQAVYQAALQANAATVVFSLPDNQSLASLARLAHSLRRQRGSALKIVFREMRRVLRYQDEQVLLACGVTLVVPAGTHLSRLFSLLEGIQGQVYTSGLVADPESLIESRSPIPLHGFTDPESFLMSLEQIQERPVNHGVVLVLTPVRRLTVTHAMSQLNLRRMGDFGCELDGAVYLYLFGCRSSLVEVALTKVFRLPYREIFSECQVCATELAINGQIHEMRRALRKREAFPSEYENRLTRLPQETETMPRLKKPSAYPTRPQLGILPLTSLNDYA